MIFNVISIFPEIFESFLSASLISKALKNNVLDIKLINPREFAKDQHKTVDDRPYGGGPGMILKPEPLAEAIEKVKKNTSGPVIYLSPSGTLLKQAKIADLAHFKDITLLCGRYEGIDQRVIDLYVDEEISIGDYVVNGGEIPAMVLIEAVARLLPGFMGKIASSEEESHSQGVLLEGAQYTRPESFKGLKVPEALLSGNHRLIEKYRLEKALERTMAVRPELIFSDSFNPWAFRPFVKRKINKA